MVKKKTKSKKDNHSVPIKVLLFIVGIFVFIFILNIMFFNPVGPEIAGFDGELIVKKGFILGCGGKPDVTYVEGYDGQGAIQLYSTGGDGLACMVKELPPDAKEKGYTIYFYGKGYVRAGIWNHDKVRYVSYLEEVGYKQRMGNGQTRAWLYLNNQEPYDDWILFKLVVYEDSDDDLKLYFYNKGGAGSVGKEYAGYYDQVYKGIRNFDDFQEYIFVG